MKFRKDVPAQKTPDTSESVSPGLLPRASTNRQVVPRKAPAPKVVCGIEPMLRMSDVLTLLQLSAATVYRMVREGKFPAPVRIGKTAVGFRRDQVIDWFAERSNEKRPPREKPVRRSL